MQARIKNHNEVTIVALSGRVDVETAPPFRAACFREFRGKRLVFDFADLSFVGSQGILPFLETFQVFNETAPGSFKFCRMGLEFRRVFAATPLNCVELYETIEGAVASFYLPKVESTALVTAFEAAPLAEGYLCYKPEPVEEAKKTSDSFESDDDLDL